MGIFDQIGSIFDFLEDYFMGEGATLYNFRGGVMRGKYGLNVTPYSQIKKVHAKASKNNIFLRMFMFIASIGSVFIIFVLSFVFSILAFFMATKSGLISDNTPKELGYLVFLLPGLYLIHLIRAFYQKYKVWKKNERNTKRV